MLSINQLLEAVVAVPEEEEVVVEEEDEAAEEGEEEEEVVAEVEAVVEVCQQSKSPNLQKIKN